jgi:hypothetical protein
VKRLGFLAACFLVWSSAVVLAQAASPTVYLAAQPFGNTWDAKRDQSQEMSKDFAKNCPSIQVSADKQANYGVRLNHGEAGQAVRDNQFSVVDGLGNVLATREQSSMNRDVKSICELITADWNNEASLQAKLVKSFNDAFAKNNIEGYAEYKDGNLAVHSARATVMRFHMIINSGALGFARQAGIKTIRYTNDADQDLTYDLATAQIATTDKSTEGSDAPAPQSAAQSSTTTLTP